jgi:hypothetical protein
MTKLIIFSLIVILVGFTLIDTCGLQEGIDTLTINEETTESDFSDDIAQSLPADHANANHEHILKQHIDLQGMREEIREDLMEIQKDKNSHYAEQKLAYDRTIYGTLMLTVIATCLIYFIFVEL